MKTFNRKLLFLDKSFLALISLIIIALIVIVMTFAFTGKHVTAINALKNQISEIEATAAGVTDLKNIVVLQEKRIKSGRTKGVVSSLEQILKNLGMEALVLKPLDKKKTGDFTEENAEMEIQNTDLNSIVNLLYKIENSSAPMKISNALINSSFENPDKFTLKLTVSLLSK